MASRSAPPARPRLIHYRLIGKLAVPCRNFEEWGEWLASALMGGIDPRIVKQEHVGPLFVSTVFLGHDHNFGTGEPLLFETMIFDALEDSYQTRCTTWDQAEFMHETAVTVAKAQWARAQELLEKKTTT